MAWHEIAAAGYKERRRNCEGKLSGGAERSTAHRGYEELQACLYAACNAEKWHWYDCQSSSSCLSEASIQPTVTVQRRSYRREALLLREKLL